MKQAANDSWPRQLLRIFIDSITDGDFHSFNPFQI